MTPTLNTGWPDARHRDEGGARRRAAGDRHRRRAARRHRPAAAADRGRQAADAGAEGAANDAQFCRAGAAAAVLSNLLWAAWGINRPDGRRTAPSARNWQEIDVYVATPRAVHLRRQGARTEAGRGARRARADRRTAALARSAADAGLRGRRAENGGADEESRRNYAAADAAFIAQNVYLFCASEGLASVVFAMVDRPAFTQAAG